MSTKGKRPSHEIGTDIADAITPRRAVGAPDAAGGHVSSLTEAVMGVTAALCRIADAISEVAGVLRPESEERVGQKARKARKTRAPAADEAPSGIGYQMTILDGFPDLVGEPVEAAKPALATEADPEPALAAARERVVAEQQAPGVPAAEVFADLASDELGAALALPDDPPALVATEPTRFKVARGDDEETGGFVWYVIDTTKKKDHERYCDEYASEAEAVAAAARYEEAAKTPAPKPPSAKAALKAARARGDKTFSHTTKPAPKKRRAKS